MIMLEYGSLVQDYHGVFAGDVSTAAHFDIDTIVLSTRLCLKCAAIIMGKY